MLFLGMTFLLIGCQSIDKPEDTVESNSNDGSLPSKDLSSFDICSHPGDATDYKQLESFGKCVTKLLRNTLQDSSTSLSLNLDTANCDAFLGITNERNLPSGSLRAYLANIRWVHPTEWHYCHLYSPCVAHTVISTEESTTDLLLNAGGWAIWQFEGHTTYFMQENAYIECRQQLAYE